MGGDRRIDRENGWTIICPERTCVRFLEKILPKKGLVSNQVMKARENWKQVLREARGIRSDPVSDEVNHD